MLEIKAENRDIFGKKLVSFRKKGKLPAILYGPKAENRAIFVSSANFKKIWAVAGESTVIQIRLTPDVKKSPTSDVVEVLIYEVAVDPVKSEPVHVDFYAVQMDKLIEASALLNFEGISPAVKDFGGILVKVMHELQVEALPKNLPHELIIDISKLVNLGDKILAKDINLPGGVELKVNPEEVVVLIETPKEEAVLTEEEKIAFEEIKVAGKKEKEEVEEK
jgi:large subunit ribosomal protein L25